MRRRDFLMTAAIGGSALAAGISHGAQAENALPASASSPLASQSGSQPGAQSDYEYFVNLLEKIGGPIVDLLANERLHRDFPIEVSTNADGRDQRVAYLECFGRTIAGIAPWIALNESGPHERSRLKMRENALQAYEHSVNPKSKDYLDWNLAQGQMLVDSAYYTQAMLRAPLLWNEQSATTKKRIVKEIKALRTVAPPYTNWLLFAAMNEAFLMNVGEEYDPIRLDYALRKFREWYAGDGWFADGEHFAFDYYGSYVIHPMLQDILDVMAKHEAYFWRGDIKDELEIQIKRNQRFAEHLERLISPTGTYPPIGRSLTYRTAAFQPLAQLALNHQLPQSLSPAQVRSAMRAVHEAVFSNPTNFTKEGFLRIGFVGANQDLGDWYSNSGSMYITTASLLPLGLPSTDPYWQDPSEDWTQKRAFSGKPFKKDYPVTY